MKDLSQWSPEKVGYKSQTFGDTIIYLFIVLPAKTQNGYESMFSQLLRLTLQRSPAAHQEMIAILTVERK